MILQSSDIITIFASFIGFVATFLGIRHQLINAVKKSINDDRKQVYLDIYKLMNKTVIDPNISFSQEYVEELQELKPQVYLLSSKKVANKYKDYCNEIYVISEDYKNYCFENDPTSKSEGVDEWDMDCFEYKKSLYKQKNVLSRADYKQILDNILSVMRKDIGIKD